MDIALRCGLVIKESCKRAKGTSIHLGGSAISSETRLMNNKTDGCSGEHPYNLLGGKLFESLNSCRFGVGG